MNTLWSFGDSFTHPFDNNWIAQISSGLNLENKSFGFNGSSLDFTYLAVNRFAEQFKEDDVVIVALTEVSRQWVIKDQPGCTHIQSLEALVPKSDIMFYYRYFMTCVIPEVVETRLENFLWALKAKTLHLKQKPIIFFCFGSTLDVMRKKKLPEFNYVNWPLKTVCEQEIAIKDRQKKFVGEPRINHLMPVNHKILASKVLDHIKNSKEITLDGFAREILTHEQYHRMPSVLSSTG